MAKYGTYFLLASHCLTSYTFTKMTLSKKTGGFLYSSFTSEPSAGALYYYLEVQFYGKKGNQWIKMLMLLQAKFKFCVILKYLYVLLPLFFLER